MSLEPFCKPVVLCFVVLAFIAGSSVAIAAPGLLVRPDNLTCSVPDRPSSTASIALDKVLSIAWPTAMVQAPNDATRWYVADRSGYINVYNDGSTFTEIGTFVDIQDRVTRELGGATWGEMGLLSIAFHPNFDTNGFVYLYYSAVSDVPGSPVEARLSRFTSLDGGLTLDPASEQILVTSPRDTQWHWGGTVLFGGDGYLYLSLGDAGRHFNAQDLNVLKGKILRIDVDSAFPYAIPPDNPFANGGGRPEIYAYGFRNPWRYSVDPATGVIWLGDVGLNSIEEVNQIVSGGNYGFSILEGNQCSGLANCDTTGLSLVDPYFEFPHDPNAAFTALIGGYVYRGTTLSNLQGRYLFAENFTGALYVLNPGPNGEPEAELLLESNEFTTSMAQSLDNELFLLAESGVFKLNNAGPPVPDTFPQQLSQTGCFDAADPRVPAAGLIPYDVNTALWSDGATKSRWLAVPDGTTIDINSDGDWDFPIGTVLAKTFSLDSVLVETRLFMRHDDGDWAGYSYEWNDQQTDATLLPGQKIKSVNNQTWVYPSRGGCLQCHTDIAGDSLGLENAQQNGDFLYPSTGIVANQIETLAHLGMFTTAPDLATLPSLKNLADISAPVADRARSYLHANCAYCHQPGGPGQGPEDFRYSGTDEELGAINVLPTQSDLGVSDARLIVPSDPSKSIVSLRMHTTGNERMPPIATSLVDTQATSIVDAWISDMDPQATCGEPIYDPTAQAALYFWEDCATGAWHVRSAAGGAASTAVFTVTTDSPVQNLVEFSIEAHDTLGPTSPNKLEATLRTWGEGEDGFSFDSVSDACVELASPVGLPIYVGSMLLAATSPIDLTNSGACEVPVNTLVADGQPSFDPSSDPGLYVWRDPLADLWTVQLSAGGTFAQYSGQIDSMAGYSSSATTELEAHDFFEQSDTPGQILFNLLTWNAGIDSFTFTLAGDGDTCLSLDQPLAGPVFVGEDSTVATLPFDLKTLASCVPGDSTPPLQGFRISETSPGVWQIRATTDAPFSNFVGNLTSSEAILAVTPQSIEAHDALTTATNQVSFDLKIWGSGEDTFVFEAPQTSDLCLTLDQTEGEIVLIGSDVTPVTTPIDPRTGGSCQ